MNALNINSKARIDDFKQDLKRQELTDNTIIRYMTDVEQLEEFLDGKDPTQEDIIQFKKELLEVRKFKPSTIKNKIISINKYFTYLDREDLKVKNIREQNHGMAESMSDTDYKRVMRQAVEKGTPRDVLMLQIFYSTGIRVSELKYFTVEAVKRGYIHAYNKGKYRDVPITKKLSKLARDYTTQNNIKKGAIILSRAGNPLGRNAIYKRIKRLGGQARIKKTKAYPHSIRHLFAKNFLKTHGGNYVQLADILGHESLKTTRLYTGLDINETRAIMELVGE